MGKFVRHKNSKRLSWRAGSGRFAGTPTVEAAFGLRVYVCAACRAFNPVTPDFSTGFKVYPKPEACQRCNATPFQEDLS